MEFWRTNSSSVSCKRLSVSSCRLQPPLTLTLSFRPKTQHERSVNQATDQYSDLCHPIQPRHCDSVCSQKNIMLSSRIHRPGELMACIDSERAEPRRCVRTAPPRGAQVQRAWRLASSWTKCAYPSQMIKHWMQKVSQSKQFSSITL